MTPMRCDFAIVDDDRAAAASWAMNLLSRTDVVILDLETCGLYEMAHICEIAIIRPDGSELLNTRVRPAIPIPADATAIHGISDSDVAQAPSIHLIAHGLNALLDGVQTIVTYNASFDRGAMDLSLTAGDIHPDWKRWAASWQWQCAMNRYAEWYGDWSDYHGNYRYQPLNGGHNALADCRACLNRIRQMAGEAPLTWTISDSLKTAARPTFPS